MEIEAKENQIQLALNAYKKGQFKQKKVAALAFDIPPTTPSWRLNGIVSRSQKVANCQKLSETEEATLSAWISDMHQRGLPLQLSAIRYLA